MIWLMSSQPKADAPLAQKNRHKIVAIATTRVNSFLLLSSDDCRRDEIPHALCGVKRLSAKSRMPFAGTPTFHKVLGGRARRYEKSFLAFCDI